MITKSVKMLCVEEIFKIYIILAFDTAPILIDKNHRFIGIDR